MRRSRSSTDSAMAAPMPGSTPKSSTAAVVASASTSSLRRKAAIRRSSATSTSRIAAKTTTAPSAAVGKAAMTGPSQSRVATTRTRETSECSWVRAPIVSAITVRLPLELIGKPWKRPVATLAVPSARNSWSLSMRLAVPGAEGTAGQDVVGVADDGDAERRRQQGPQVDVADVGQRQGRQALRHRTDDVDAGAVDEVEDRDDDGGAQHRDEGAGPGRREALEGEEDGEDAERQDERRQVRVAEVGQDVPHLLDERLALHRDAEDLADLADDHERRDARHVADEDRLREQVGEEAEPQDETDEAR